MKKTLFFAAGAILAMVACSKDETTGVNTGDGIEFRSAMGTRAEETTIDNLNDFKVTALNAAGETYFSDELFKKKAGGTTFFSDKTHYWPSDGVLSFYAYAPSSLAGVTIDNKTKAVTFTPETEINSQLDFITGNASGSKAENEGVGVGLAFTHRLSQIAVRAKNTNTAYVYKIKGVKIGQPVSSGTFDFGTEAWTSLGSDKVDYTIEYDQEITLGVDAVNIMGTNVGKDTENNAMLIPQQLNAWTPADDGTNAAGHAYLSVLVNIKTDGGTQMYPKASDEYGWAAVGINTQWAPNTKYVYTLDFSKGAGYVDPGSTPNDQFKPGDIIFGRGIFFDVKVEKWTDANPQPGVEM